MSDSDGVREVRFPLCISLGAVGGPRFSTTVNEHASGFEQRNSNWSKQRCKFDVARTLDTPEKVQELLNFFYGVARGRAYAFRFKDASDFEFDQVVGTGTGSQQTIQLFKRYSLGGYDYDRILQKIVAGSYTVFINDVAQDEGSPASIDENTGILTVTAPLGQSIRVEGEFDVPVRFDIDDLSLLEEEPDFFRSGSIPLVEVRIPTS